MPTAYINEQDLKDRFGDAEVSQLASVGANAVGRAVADASEEAESYVAVQYRPPLPNIPSPLKAATCDIARYRLYKDRAPENVKDRYEQAIAWLKALAAAKVKLTFDPALTVEEKKQVVEPPAVVGRVTGGTFSASVLARMPGDDPELNPLLGPF